MKWRLIIHKQPHTAFENMGIDAALQELCTIPVLRLYTWQPPAVSIGRFQSLHDEVDEQQCKKNDIDIVRRITGGGAVFHDAEVTYSICIREKNEYFSKDLHESYQAICGAVMNGLKKCGLESVYVPINDIIVNGKKISGCAQTRKKGIILQHGTLLVDVDVDKMFSLLKVPDEKIRDKMIASVKERVTSIHQQLGKKVSNEEVMTALADGFKEFFNIEFESSELTPKEKKRAAEIQKTVFETWSYER